MRSPDDDSRGPVIRDRRRVDPVTGQVRDAGRQGGQGQAGPPQRGAQPRPGRHAVSKPGGGASGGRPGGAPQGGGQGNGSPGNGGNGPGASAQDSGHAAEADLASKLAERTADLQRLQAEYANYRKRVERDRMAVREQALANVLTELLPVLDDIGRAREHGELSGGFKSVAESLEGVAVKLGLTSYGEDGDPFDPNVHEAVLHDESEDVTETICSTVMRKGYRHNDRLLRPAMVTVARRDGAPSCGRNCCGRPSRAWGRPGSARGATG